jgi:Fur family ferric uptake transcriptional regulator
MQAVKPEELEDRESSESSKEAEASLTTRFLKQRQDRLDREVLKLAQSLIRHGYKVTNPRLEIIEAITTFENSFNIEELTERVNERAKIKNTQPPGIASVFRSVKLLTEDLGLLQRMHSGDGCHRYALQRGHQHQVVCRCCEQTIEFEGCDFSELTHFLETKTGFKLEGHWMEFFGLCAVCREAQPENGGEPIRPQALRPHTHPEQIERQLRQEPLDVSQISQNPNN